MGARPRARVWRRKGPRERKGDLPGQQKGRESAPQRAFRRTSHRLILCRHSSVLAPSCAPKEEEEGDTREPQKNESNLSPSM